MPIPNRFTSAHETTIQRDEQLLDEINGVKGSIGLRRKLSYIAGIISELPINGLSLTYSHRVVPKQGKAFLNLVPYYGHFSDGVLVGHRQRSYLTTIQHKLLIPNEGDPIFDRSFFDIDSQCIPTTYIHAEGMSGIAAEPIALTAIAQFMGSLASEASAGFPNAIQK